MKLLQDSLEQLRYPEVFQVLHHGHREEAA